MKDPYVGSNRCTPARLDGPRKRESVIQVSDTGLFEHGLFDHGGVDSLVGRGVALERIRGFLDATDRGGALLLSGAAGVGKTVLLDAVAEAAVASGSRVVRAAGVEFEADVSYSGLNQVLFPFYEAFGELETSQADALQVALGFGSGAPPERLVVSNATLMLLRHVAKTAPLLLIVDDLPWLDRASAAVLGFVARRLNGSRVTFLGALRSGSDGAGYSGAERRSSGMTGAADAWKSQAEASWMVPESRAGHLPIWFLTVSDRQRTVSHG